MKYCPDCGCENIDEAQFCRNCGMKFKGNEVRITQTQQDVAEVNGVQKTAGIETNPIISRLFYKTDKYTGNLRFAKAKSISIIFYVFMFLFALASGVPGASWFVYLLTAIIFALIFAIPTYVLGYIVGIIIDKIQNG